MRVIAGKYRGRKLLGPKHQGLRPTADRVKEALFNIIGAKIIDADFLDLFTGTGAIGIEALSRGAQSVVFSDDNNSSIKLLRENLKILVPDDQYRVFHLPGRRVLEILSKENCNFDIIFLDPPFKAGLLQETIQAIINFNLLKDDALITVEHPRDLVISDPGFPETQTRQYGDISLTFFWRNKN